ncbi:phosphatase PAP2 family protein [Kineococcus gynurae]|uniref:Phosphatase PAP2 family protein n=1 Tax=Kineococcus gynurae TaxID=452979 RepID=A0ABV5LUV1_9ACTN
MLGLHLLVRSGVLAPVEVPLVGEAVGAALGAPRLTAVAQVVERATEPVVLYAVGLGAVVLAWSRGWRRPALVVLVAGVVGAVTSPVLKAIVDRVRPAVEAGLTTAGGGAFPSGHALASATVLGLLLLVLHPPRTRRSALLRGTGTVALLGLVGVDRVWLGAHWPSDVLAGWLLGLAIVLTARAVLGPRPASGDRAAGR